MLSVKCWHAVFFLLGCAAMVAAQSQNAPQSPNLPPGPLHQSAVTACMECHDSNIIVQQRLSRASWGKEIDKMMKWGALVNAKDRDALIEYFSTNFGSDKAPYIAPQTSALKAAKQRKR